MKKNLLNEIILKKQKKIEFAIITNIENGESCIFEKNKPLDKNFEKYKNKISSQYETKNNGIIEGTNIFVEMYPAFEPYLLALTMRGAVSGLGVVNLFAAITEFGSIVRPSGTAW